jgi:hypothetical protein
MPPQISRKGDFTMIFTNIATAVRTERKNAVRTAVPSGN